MATGLGTPNAYNLVYSSVWGPVQQPQTITFPNPGPLVYGVSPVTLTATATSGLQVTYTVISGPATVDGSVLTITGAGNVVVEADQAGNSNWQAAPPVQDTIVVNPATLTVTANAASMTYGDSLPTFTASYNGFVNGDNQGVLSGSPSLTTHGDFDVAGGQLSHHRISGHSDCGELHLHLRQRHPGHQPAQCVGHSQCGQQDLWRFGPDPDRNP